MAEKDAVSFALKLLETKDYFAEELRFKTACRYGNAEADKVIDALKSYLDDEKVAENYIRSKLLSGYGPYYISGKLFERGYSISVDDILKKADEEDIDVEAEIKKLAKKHMAGRLSDPYKAWQKCMAFLHGRGYPGWLCEKVIKKGDYEK